MINLKNLKINNSYTSSFLVSLSANKYFDETSIIDSTVVSKETIRKRIYKFSALYLLKYPK
jgi:hypothetical protein